MGWLSSLIGGTIGFFVGGPVGAAIGAGIGATSVGDKVVNAVLDFVLQPFMKDFDVPSSDETARQQGVLVTKKAGGATSIPVIYGLRKTGGAITFAETGSTNNKYLWVAYVFTEGPVEGLYETYIDDVQLDGKYIADLNAGKEVSITDGKFAKRVTMRWSPGVYFPTPSSSTLGTELKASLFKDSPSFKSTMTYNGLATLFVRYEWLAINTQAEADANPFSGSIPGVSCVILGRKVASLTTTTSASYEYGASGYSERYSTNPAEILLDYLRNPRYGKGLKNNEIDWPSFRIAAAKCNTEVTYTTSNIKGPIMTCNYVLDTNTTIFQNVKYLLQGMRSYLPYVQGKYKLKVEDAGNETDITSGSAYIVAECVTTYQTIDASLLDNTYEIMGDVTYTGIDRSSKYNQVVVTYVDPRTEYKWSNQQVVYPETEAERLSYVALDGNRENKLEITLPTITNYAMAADFAKILFNKSRYQESATLCVSSHAFELEPGDNIRIQSKLLNFGDVPWRVINISHKANYTFDIGCVRNPDFLYPYTRIGEADRVRPIYVPQGAVIYYPKDLDRPDLSLVPPTSAISSGDGTDLNPDPSDPTGTDGGGVGGNTGSTNINQSNNTPTGAPKVQPLNDVIDITNISYVTKNNLVYARLTFVQPVHPMYSGIDYYYGLGGRTDNVVKGSETTIAGAGARITFDLGPLAVISSLQPVYNSYGVWARVRYSSGEYSTQFVRFNLNPATQADAGTNPSETVQISSNSWPSFSESDPSRTDTSIEVVTGNVPSLGSAGTARDLYFTLTQQVRTEAPNYNVNGVNIYWKLSTDTYYYKTSQAFSPYAPGTAFNWKFTGDVGVSGGPVAYDFVFRLTFTSGVESSKQYVLNGLKMESPFTVYPYDPTYGFNNVSATKTVSEYPISTVDQAPPGTVASALDTKLGIGSSNAGINAVLSGTTQGMKFFLDPPAAANLGTFRGTKIRYRAVVAGSNPSLTSQTDLQVKAGTSGVIAIPVYGMSFDQKYEVIITPQVLSGGTVQDSNYSLRGVGYVHNRTAGTDYPLSGNWAPTFGFEQLDTATALNKSNQAFDAADPTVDIISCDNKYSFATNANYNGLYKNGSVVTRTNYVRLVYNGDKISGLSALKIYRRHRTTSFGTTGNTGSSYAKHHGVGRWELVNVVHSGTGNKIVNLRMPTSYKEFTTYYGVTGYTGLSLTTVGAGEPANSIPLLYGDGSDVDWLIVAVIGSTVSNKGLLIRSSSITAGTTSVSMTSPNLPKIVTYASEPTIQDSDYTAGYNRRLGDARAPITVGSTAATTQTDFYIITKIGGSSATQVLATGSDGPATV